MPEKPSKIWVDPNVIDLGLHSVEAPPPAFPLIVRLSLRDDDVSMTKRTLNVRRSGRIKREKANG